jgi:hypothetical protein
MIDTLIRFFIGIEKRPHGTPVRDGADPPRQDDQKETRCMT